jgi:hypothetical protein
MRPAAWRLVLMSVLFAGWMLYLGYLVYSRPLAQGRPLVLSRPQVLVSELDVVAEVDSTDPAKPVRIEEVLYPVGEKSVAVGGEIHVENLTECRSPLREDEANPPPDWTGPGKYLLPLVPLHRPAEDGKPCYRVAPTPRSPGYPRPPHDTTPGPPRIYPATAQALAQYRDIRKP